MMDARVRHERSFNISIVFVFTRSSIHSSAKKMLFFDVIVSVIGVLYD
jgi:hypothetical protein